MSHNYGMVESYNEETGRGVIEYLTGGKVRFIVPPGQKGIAVGTPVDFDVAQCAVNVKPTPQNKTEQPEIVRGQSAMDLWASETKQVREGSAESDAPSVGYHPFGS
jgi:hypothetical protein